MPSESARDSIACASVYAQVFKFHYCFLVVNLFLVFSQQIDLMNRYPFSISFQRSACISIRCLFVTLGIVLFNFQGTSTQQMVGGPGWARTTDLTLIRRAL